jgi:hypothetical protein
MLSSQFSALVTPCGLCGWFIGHQSSHCFALVNGQAKLNPLLARIMGIETFLGSVFIVWLAFKEGIAYAAGVFALSFVVRLALVKLQEPLGLTEKAWIISLSGIIAVPALLLCLVLLVLHPISQ